MRENMTRHEMLRSLTWAAPVVFANEVSPWRISSCSAWLMLGWSSGRSRAMIHQTQAPKRPALRQSRRPHAIRDSG